MKLLLILYSVLVLSGMYLIFIDNKSDQQEQPELNQDYIYQLYELWVDEYNKEKSDFRYKIFEENVNKIEQHNASGSSYNLDLNEFGDMTLDEFISLKIQGNLGTRPTGLITHDFIPSTLNISSVDWVNQGAVTGVKNQGQCIASQAFSATACLETAYWKATGVLKDFSEQQLVSCDGNSHGCGGGWPETGLFHNYYYGIQSRSTYPYVQENDYMTKYCEYDSSKGLYRNYGIGKVSPNNPNEMVTKLQFQPVTAMMNAASFSYMFYSSGVFDLLDCSEVNVNHSVAIVGYNSAGQYWRIKNSWGTGWGQNGYMYVDAIGGAGICGINTNVFYPVL